MLTCYVNNLHAQKNSSDYIIKDSTYAMGVVSPLGKEKIQFQLTKKQSPVIYSALDIKEYGHGGEIFESLLIDGNQRFLKRIVSGKVTLYQDKKQFAIRVDSGLIIFNKGDYRSMISQSLKCEDFNASLLKLSYSKAALKNYVEAYNLGSCSTLHFPHKKMGAYLGYNFLQFTTTFNSSLKIKDKIVIPTVGIFVDFPMFRPRSLFLTTELNWYYGKPLFYDEGKSKTSYSGLQVNSINSLIGCKWLINQGNTKTHFKVGGLLSFINLESPTGLIETSLNGSIIEISQLKISETSALIYGLYSGLGFEIPYRDRKNFHLELRYLKSFEGDFDFLFMNYSGVSITVGFNL